MMIRFLVGLLLVGLLAACSTVVNAGAASKWPGVARDYLRDLRWREFDAAAACYAEEQRDSFLARRGRLAALQFVDGRLESAVLAEDSRHAETVIVLDYYRLPSATVRQAVVRQSWEYRPEQGAWFVVTPLPTIP